MEITEAIVNKAKALGDEASLNLFVGVVTTIAQTNKGDRILQERYNRLLFLIRRCKNLEAKKQTNTAQYRKDMVDSEHLVKSLLAHLKMKQYIKPKKK